jgi:Protein of unknown function (DUF2817)
MNDNFFSSSYVEARALFAATCKGANASMQSYINPMTSKVEGGLTLDTARFGSPGARNALVLVSGTHGVEGYCGSACQVAATSLGMWDDLPRDTAILLIHSLNPYGFAYGRRVNEDNVDLNRNCVADFRKACELNPEYDELSDLLNPAQWTFDPPHPGFDQIQSYIKAKKIPAFQSAVSAGQYRHSRGLFYGGAAPTWSRQILEDIVASELDGAGCVVVIDYHTGLGPAGVGELICMESDQSDAYSRSRRLYGNGVKSTQPFEREKGSVSAAVNGSICETFEREGREATYVSLEFGTVPMMEVLEALRGENWLHHYGTHDNSLKERIGSKVLEAFNPTSARWRQSVLHRSAQVLTQAVQGLCR